MSATSTLPASCGECVLRLRASNFDCLRCATEQAITATIDDPAPVRRASRSRSAIAIVLLVITATCWGSAFRFTEIALAELPPLEITFLRCAIGAVVVGIAAALQQRSAPARITSTETAPSRRTAWLALLVGGTCTGIAYATISLGQVGATSTTTGVILGTVPVWTALFVLLAGRAPGASRRPTPRLMAALSLGSAAATVPALADPASAPLWAVALLLVAALSHGGSMAVIQPAVERFGPLRSTTGVNVLATLLVAPALFVGPHPAMPTTPVVASMLVLGLLPTGLAYVTFFHVVRMLGARTAALAVYLIPAVALTVGWLSDPRLVAPATVLGAIFGIAAVTVGVTGRPPARSQVQLHRPRRASIATDPVSTI